MADRYDILVGGGGHTAGAEAGAVVGEVASVLGLPGGEGVVRTKNTDTLLVE